MHCPILSELPPSPAGKTGWPWTEESAQLPTLAPDNSEWPCISIITPSYNQGEFIEETIRSVLLQGYPNLEYIIIDGGSNDRTTEIIEKYSQWISYWVSEPDQGQANAVNKGMSHSTGTILNFLNSDDFLLPGAVSLTAQVLLGQTNKLIASYGFRLRVDEQGQTFDFDLSPRKIDRLTFRLGCWIPSETFFFTRKVFDAVQGFNEDLKFALDYDFYVRCLQVKTKFVCIEEFIGVIRFHTACKSVDIPAVGNNEFLRLRKTLLGNNSKAQVINWFCDSILGKFVFHKNKYNRRIWQYLNSAKIENISKS
jgi:glycosyltransferase involved in cell wall biosynthesis